MVAVIRFTSEFSSAPQAVNVWHFRCPATATTALANEAISAVDAFFEAIKNLMAPGTWTHGNRVITVDQTPNVVVPATPLQTSTTGSNTYAMQVSAGVQWSTAFIGKSYRGRSYIGPLQSLAIAASGNQITGSFQSDLLTASNALRAPTAGGAQLCVWSEKLQQANLVTGSAIPSLLRTQRRRLT